MSNTTPVPGAQPVAIDINELYRQKGELVTQMTIGQQRLQEIDQQIAKLLNLR